MGKVFNTTADCKPQLHYMVDIGGRLEEMKDLVEKGEYFTINRARQYGKTTALRALKKALDKEYLVVSLDFQKMGDTKFRNENIFSIAFAKLFLRSIRGNESEEALSDLIKNHSDSLELLELFENLSDICAASLKPVVLMIDEVDSATNNQVFLDFLAQLRAYYIDRDVTPTFQSVILAGVYDVKNLKRKIGGGEERKVNSPWNIAADFNVDMSFSVPDIFGMIAEYEKDYHTGMDVGYISRLVYEYTSGYPFLVSRLCQIMDERIAGNEGFSGKAAVWTKEGFLEAVKILLSEKNTLFETLVKKVAEYPELKRILYAVLFTGEKISFNHDNDVIDLAFMLGFVKNEKGMAVIANRLFETRLYNLFLSEDEMDSRIFTKGTMDKNQFIQNGMLDMDLVMKKFLVSRDHRRTDIIVDYRGRQHIVEIKIWRGDEYNKRGERQLAEYLEAYHVSKGYLLSFNFNKKKVRGTKEISVGGKRILEVVV